MKNIFTFLNLFTDLSEEAFIELQSISNFKKIEIGTRIVKFNEIPTKVYLLVSGIMRSYLSTESGKEYNKNFFLPINPLASLTALINENPSLLTIEALTPCEIYEVDYSKLKHLCEKNSSINKLYTRILEAVYVKYENRLIELISLDAKQRYLELRLQIPDLDKLIQQYHIASYLGITPVQLSRIRNKIDMY